MVNKKTDGKIAVLTVALTCSVAVNLGLGIISHLNANKAKERYRLFCRYTGTPALPSLTCGGQ